MGLAERAAEALAQQKALANSTNNWKWAEVVKLVTDRFGAEPALQSVEGPYYYFTCDGIPFRAHSTRSFWHIALVGKCEECGAELTTIDVSGLEALGVMLAKPEWDGPHECRMNPGWCPMRQGRYECCKSKCAWWMDWGCAVTTIANNLEALSPA